MIAAAPDVRLEEVEKRYGAVQALHALDLEIPRGIFFSLLGPSGCGKTTTLRLVAGFEEPTAGRVYIRGRDVTRIPPYRRDFSMVFQSFALFPHLSVVENVAFGLRMRRVARAQRIAKAREALGLVRLDALAERYPKQLSGGQQQRVALARALVVEPAVLLLDEPLGALDKALREEMQTELRSLQRRLGITAIFVTHDQEEALTLSDRIAVMRDGRIEQQGAPRMLYERPATQFVATFLGASNLVPGKVIAAGVVETPLGKAAVSGLDRPVGSMVTLALRPERLRAFRPEGGLGQATVREIVYRGATTLLTLEAGPLTLQTQQQNAGGEAALAEGDAVGLAWDADALVPLAGP